MFDRTEQDKDRTGQGRPEFQHCLCVQLVSVLFFWLNFFDKIFFLQVFNEILELFLSNLPQFLSLRL